MTLHLPAPTRPRRRVCPTCKPMTAPTDSLYQHRVVAERTALDGNIVKLSAFINGNPIFKTLPQDEQGRLVRQLKAMNDYSDILGERIAAFRK